jgi:hypothetical protein
MQLRNTPLVTIAILALITPLVCSGASYAYLDDGELWRESDTIVIGNVTSITSVKSGTSVHHDVEIKVERYLKNPSESSFLVVLYSTHESREFVSPGGDTVPSVAGDVEWGFKVGERVYVFLRSVTPEYYEVVGGFQGKYSFVSGLAMNSIGRVIRIPTPSSQTVMKGVAFGATFGAVFLITIWIKRDWLSERIGGV